MKYLLMLHIEEGIEPDPEDTDPNPWVDEMTARGVRTLGSRLRPASDSTSVRVRDGELSITEGPFAESKEEMAGFDLLECADLDEAIEVASKHPAAKFGTLELRPLWED